MDLIAFRVAATVPEQDPFDICEYRMDVMLRGIFDATESEEFIGYLTGKSNFRKKVNQQYKAQRKDKVPPHYLQDCRKYLVDHYNATVVDGIEADDQLGIMQTADTVICTIDKDLKQIPGHHFNFVKTTFDFVEPSEGRKFFWKQMMIGDTSDNIFGVTGIGPKKADKLIDPCSSDQECFERVWSLYNEDAARFVMNAQCLWIMKRKDETWVNQVDLILPDSLRQEVDRMSEFMKSLKATTSMEPGTNPSEMCGTPPNGIGTDTTPTKNLVLI